MTVARTNSATIMPEKFKFMRTGSPTFANERVAAEPVSLQNESMDLSSLRQTVRDSGLTTLKD